MIYYHSKDKEQLNLTTKIAKNTNDAILITDKDTRITFVNKSFEQITGFKASEVIGLKTNHFKSGLHTSEFYQDMWNKINTTGSWSGEVWDRKKDGVFYPKLLHIYSIKSKYSNNTIKYIGIYSDLTRIKENEANINRLKNFNLDTDLPNESFLKKLVDLRVLNKDHKPFGLFYFSILNYNDMVFNKTSEEVSQNINSFINKIHEILTQEDFIAQISKNTFAIGLISYSSKNNIKKFAKQFFKINQNRISTIKDGFFFEIKAGIAIYPDDDITSEGLLSSASIALEAAKGDKTHDFIFSSPKLKEEVNRVMKMSLLLRKSIINNELSVNYQPQVNIKTNKIEGAEALIRWNNPDLGNISPFFFIPIAEKSGYIIDIGYWLIERVFKDFKEIENIVPDNFKISINVSPIQFQDLHLIEKFKDFSDKYSIDLSKFEIEITESILVKDVNIVNIKLQNFKRLGLSILRRVTRQQKNNFTNPC